MDKAEFARRIAVYLEQDAPALERPDEVAAALSDHLWQYTAASRVPNEFDEALDADLLNSILGPGVAVFVFTARWDANSIGYAELVEQCTDGVLEVADRVLEADVDGRIGGALAASSEMSNTPAIAVVRGGELEDRLVGRRDEDTIRRWLAGALGSGEDG